MVRRLLIASTLCLNLQASETPGPSGFYVVSVVFSDHGPSLYYRLLDVRADGPDTVVLYTRIANVNLYCPRRIVQRAEARLPNTSPAKLTKANNPCAVKPGDLRAAVRSFPRNWSVFEAISFGIVARCGSSMVTLGLPIAQTVDLSSLLRHRPEIERLWNLSTEITDLAFGPADAFHDRAAADDLALQRKGAEALPELISGRYDAGLAAAVAGSVVPDRSPTFKTLLADYRGPVTAEEARLTDIPRLLNQANYSFLHFAPPNYPRLALQARIEGKVDLKLTVDTATGQVLDAVATSGHPLLQTNALDAARQWRFAPNSLRPNPLDVTLDFTLRCP